MSLCVDGFSAYATVRSLNFRDWTELGLATNIITQYLTVLELCKKQLRCHRDLQAELIRLLVAEIHC